MKLTQISSWMQRYLALVHRFNVDIIGLPIPETPTRLSDARKDWAARALYEELDEFQRAETLENEVDALVDMSYFALGRLIEMGVVPGPAFEEVHAANMRKRKGALSKRPNSLGFDAVKPDGWTGPELLPYLSLNRSELRAAYDLALSARELTEAAQTSETEPMDTGKPKIVVLGHARHGKDTVAEILRDEYGFIFTSSSLFCAKKVVWEAVQNPQQAIDQHIAAGAPGWSTIELTNELYMMQCCNYPHFAACYAGRSAFRLAWFSLISSYLHPDMTRLGREVFAENDVYVGIRNSRELNAVINSGLAELVIWIEAGERVDQEPKASCSVEPWMAQFTIDNNGTEDDLHHNVHQLMETLGFERITKC